jgi:predicted metal-binding membrane protein
MDAAAPSTALERAIRRDRLWLAGAMVVITALAWLYLVDMAAAMQATADEAAMHAAMGMSMPGERVPLAREIAALWIMWAVMMAAMMLASATPVGLLVLRGYRTREARTARLNSAAFVGGYLLVWTLFSGVAAVAQVALREATWLAPEMMTTSRHLAAGLLIAAGVYQWLPIKAACLAHCQSPVDFLFRHWRDGVGGALAMGTRHGTYCVGCCWMLMALLFVGGVMNLLWVAAITLYVLLEKQLRLGIWPSRVAGLVLIGWGAAILLQT